jgi:SAM-dependent methyltransferase
MKYSANLYNFTKRNLKKLFLNGRRLFYFGNRYECPVCKNHFRKLIPGGFNVEIIRELEIIGAGYRLNNVCPYCLSTDRDRLVYLYLDKVAYLFNKKSELLHIGPEPSLYRIFKKNSNLGYTYATKYEEGTYYPKDIAFFDLLSVPYADNRFDVIVCNHVLEHIEDDTQAIRELFRVLKPGGYAILQVPVSYKIEKTIEDFSIVDPKERHETYGQFDHVRIYGPDYQKRLKKAGFEVEITSPFRQDWKIGNLTKYALNQKEHLFVAHKPPILETTK